MSIRVLHTVQYILDQGSKWIFCVQQEDPERQSRRTPERVASATWNPAAVGSLLIDGAAGSDVSNSEEGRTAASAAHLPLSRATGTAADSWWLDSLDHDLEAAAASELTKTDAGGWWENLPDQDLIGITDSWWLDSANQDLEAAAEDELTRIPADTYRIKPTDRSQAAAAGGLQRTTGDSWRRNTAAHDSLQPVGKPHRTALTKSSSLWVDPTGNGLSRTAAASSWWPGTAVPTLETMELGCPALLSCVDQGEYSIDV